MCLCYLLRLRSKRICRCLLGNHAPIDIFVLLLHSLHVRSNASELRDCFVALLQRLARFRNARLHARLLCVPASVQLV